MYFFFPFLFFKDTYTYMCYSKSICTRLQWRNVFEIRHYVNISNKIKKETSTDIGPTVLWQFWNHLKKIEVFPSMPRDGVEESQQRGERRGRTGAGSDGHERLDSQFMHYSFDDCRLAIKSQWKTLRLFVLWWHQVKKSGAGTGVTWEIWKGDFNVQKKLRFLSGLFWAELLDTGNTDENKLEFQ